MEGFRFENGSFPVTDEVKKFFDENGFILIRGLLSPDEVAVLKSFIETDEGFAKHRYGRDDGEGGRTGVVLWNNVTDDVTGIITRSEKVAGTMEQLLGGEVYHYHSKVIMKDAHTGGAHVWHQDYGYWYEYGCLYPNMGTVFTAIDKADQQNGCLKILRGSHKMGRFNHVNIGDQAGADPVRLKEAMKVCELLHVEMAPGDSLFFHCNLLHRSDQNRSPNRRWAFLCAYNRADNNPFEKKPHPQYVKLEKVADTAILDSKTKPPSGDRKYFHGPSEDQSLNKLHEKTAQ